MSDSAAIEAIADAFVDASNDGVALAEDYAEYALAALRADGFEIYRPDECERVDVEPWTSVDNLLHGLKVQETACHIRPGSYAVVPVGDSPKEGE